MWKYIFLSITYVYCTPYLAQAISLQEFIYVHNSNHCNNYFDYVEEKYQLPRHLLRSISAIETGRWNFRAKSYMFWPWAVHYGGKAYYYASKEDAVTSVKQLQNTGNNNIDIGCMQINLLHHPDAFRNIDQGFEPKDNIEYAASFLKRNYNMTKDWYKAVAAYHSQNDHGKNYADKVFKILSDYRNQKLYYNLCTSIYGEIIPCNSDEEKYTSSNAKDPYFAMTKLNNNITSQEKPKKDKRRLKSNMIPYSIYGTE
jgi:hypothetical protein